MNPFRRPSSRYGREPVPETPYQRAGQAWDDRIGSARAQAHSWRLMAFGATLILSLAVADNLRLRYGAKIVPYVVEVDRLGAARAVTRAEAQYRPTDPQIAWHLARFIENVRARPADPIVLRDNLASAYDFTTERGTAVLNDYARGKDPFADLDDTQISVDVRQVVRASSDSFRIAWDERRYVRGQLAHTAHWSAILTFVVRTPADAKTLSRNPLGLYVHAINWSQDLGEEE
ncbi:type IV secretion system protein VirB5 [Sphingopyxis sp. YR583]|uniref:conjugal transfer protein TrbF n=1 Tax=Sphingopyxis sp. YR583 TaxID=1881047 RepID=UPI0008A79E9C|nr:conjugal transfer protein TrbF [Sphingopyxis sp. YR583]SEH15009.1 type IV secretion system protein VirB5 [Sphingopyxis sp. YR583]